METTDSAYKITIPNASKDGENTTHFALETKKNDEDGTEQSKIVMRQYEDFEYLSHCLSAKHQMTALVMPPLPSKPAPPPTESSLKSNANQPIYKEDNFLDCKKLERFIQDIANHPCFKDDETINKFLFDDEAIARTSSRKGILNSLVNMFDSARYMHVKDVDEEFQERRDGINTKLFNARGCNTAKEKLLLSLAKYAAQYGNLAEVCRTSFINLDDNEPKMLSRFLGQFSEMLDEYQIGNQNVYKILNESVGLNMDADARYLLSCQEMLFRRTCRMVDLDNAAKALDKAKPKTREQLEVAKEEAEKEFERVSTQARAEYDNFSKQRVTQYRDSLVEYAERRATHHNKVCEFLSKGIDELKSLR